MSTTEPTPCRCNKKGCEGVDYHDRLTDRLLIDFSTLSRNALSDLDLYDENADELARTRDNLLRQRPFCSPELQGRINSGLSSQVIT